MKKTAFILFLFLNQQVAFAQSTFDTTFFQGNYNYPSSIIESGGYYYMPDEIRSCHSCASHLYLVKINQDASIIATTELDSLAYSVSCSKMIHTMDNAMVYLLQDLNPFTVAKYDTTGNRIWTYTNDTLTITFDVHQNADSTYIVCGSQGYSTHRKGGYIKLSQSGQPIWEMYYHYPLPQMPPASVCETISHDGFVGAGGNDTLIVQRIDVNGDSLVTKFFPGFGGATKILALSNKYFISGNNANGFYILCLDSACDSLWSRTYYSLNENSFVRNMSLTNNGNMLACGVTYDSSLYTSAFMASIDAGGNMIWKRQFSDINNPDFGAMESINTTDGGFLLLDYKGDAGYWACNLIKLDSTAQFLNLDNLNVESSLLIFPNPASDWFTVSGFGREDGELEIFNIFGERIYAQSYTSKEQVINCDLNSGLYFVKWTNSEESLVRKLVVKRD